MNNQNNNSINRNNAMKKVYDIGNNIADKKGKAQSSKKPRSLLMIVFTILSVLELGMFVYKLF